MADQLNEVRPGDLITADFINGIVRKLNSLAIDTGGNISVPRLFGRSLRDAKAILALPGIQLGLGVIYDPFGSLVDANNSDNLNRLVIGQIPQEGTKAFPGSSVSLVVAAVAGQGPAPGPAPTISAVIKSGGGPTDTRIPVGTEAQIVGSNFEPLGSNNTVTIDGLPVAPSPASGSSNLYFMVPEQGYAGGPPTGSTEKTVQVVVKNLARQTAQHSAILVAALTQPTPVIDDMSPDPGKLLQALAITGSGFGSDQNAVRVLFRTSDADLNPIIVNPTSMSGGNSLSVPVPDIPIVRGSQFPVAIQVLVKVGALLSPAKYHDFQK